MGKYDWITNIDTYLYIVERINEHFNNMRRASEHEVIEEEAFYLCTEILRMVPFEPKNGLQLRKKDGLCRLREPIDFIMDDLNSILQKYAKIFEKIKKIRNKYEHEPHNVSSAFSTCSGAYAGIGLYCRNDLISINTMEFTFIIYDLNLLMNKIQQLIYKTEEKNIDELDILTKERIQIIKKRKNIEYNKTYVRIPRLIEHEQIDWEVI